jgi:hypothetical protein
MVFMGRILVLLRAECSGGRGFAAKIGCFAMGLGAEVDGSALTTGGVRLKDWLSG